MAIAVPRRDREINGHLYRVDKGGIYLLKHPVFGWVNERTIHHEQRPWRPLEQVDPIAPDGTKTELAPGTTFWANGHYLVHRTEIWTPETCEVCGESESGGLHYTELRVGDLDEPIDPDYHDYAPSAPKIALVHLSMRTVENDTRHDWREMQLVKNELAGADWEAAELYPAEARVVDMANQYHLFCFPFRLPFGFPEGIRAEPGEAEMGSVQRPGAGEPPVPPSESLRAAAERVGARVSHTFHDEAAACVTDHSSRCCRAHGTHSEPHVGCVLR